MSDEEVFVAFRALRWVETGGEPVSPRCGCLAVYAFRSRPLWKCKACAKQFSVTSGTIFHGRKLRMRDYLLAVALFVNAAKGKSAQELGRDLDVSYKTAFVLAHKLREALSADQGQHRPAGTVEVDGAYFGGHVKPANRKVVGQFEFVPVRPTPLLLLRPRPERTSGLRQALTTRRS